MKLLKLLAVLFFTATILNSCPKASAADITKELIVSQGKTRAYYLYVPDKLSPAKPVPLLVVLHGSNRNGITLVEKWKDLASKEGFIVVGPDASNLASWRTPEDGPDFLRDLIEALKAKYPINPRRVYLFGHSAGASFSLYMSLFESQYFAATAIHAGALPKQAYSYIDDAKRKIPVAIWVGTVDESFPLAVVRATRDAMNERGFAVHLTEIPDHDHWYYDLAPKINKEAWEFLKKYELTEAPQFEQYQ